jgi:mRNA-degrading endonuclease toxin of MazEF toxin-antitoxin module
MNPGEIYMADLGEATSHLIVVVSFQAGQFGFTKDCVAQCENLFLVDKASLNPKPIGVLSDMALRDIIKVIGHVIDSDRESS